MKRGYSKFGIALLMIALGLVMAIGSGSAATLTVDDDGTWADHDTIQGALDAATAGDTIMVYNGTYLEYIVVDVQVDLVGNGSEDTIIDGGSELEDIVTITASGTSISGFKMTGGVMARGIQCEADEVTITDNLLFENYYGIRLAEVDNCTVTSNEILKADNYGLYLYQTDDCTFEDNHIHNNLDDGVYMSLCDDNTLEGNNVSMNDGYGIYLTLSNDNRFVLNKVMDNADGDLEMGTFCDGNEFINASVGVAGPLGGAALAGVDETLDLGDYCTKYAEGTLDYSWDFDDSDGIQEDSTTASPSWSMAAVGTYVVTLTTVDADDLETSDTMTIYVAEETYSEDDGTGDVMTENEKKVGGHSDIDITELVVWSVDDVLIFEVAVVGEIRFDWGENNMNIYTIYLFQDDSDDITDVDDADYSVNILLDSVNLEDESTSADTDVDFGLEGSNRVFIVVPIELIGNSIDFEYNAVFVSFEGFVGLSYEEAYLDFTTAPKSSSSGSSTPGMEAILVIGALAVIMVVRRKRKY